MRLTQPSLPGPLFLLSENTLFRSEASAFLKQPLPILRYVYCHKISAKFDKTLPELVRDLGRTAMVLDFLLNCLRLNSL